MSQYFPLIFTYFSTWSAMSQYIPLIFTHVYMECNVFKSLWIVTHFYRRVQGLQICLHCHSYLYRAMSPYLRIVTQICRLLYIDIYLRIVAHISIEQCPHISGLSLKSVGYYIYICLRIVTHIFRVQCLHISPDCHSHRSLDLQNGPFI